MCQRVWGEHSEFGVLVSVVSECRRMVGMELEEW